MESKSRLHLERVFDKWRIASHSTTSSQEEKQVILTKETARVPKPESRVSSTAYLQAKIATQTISGSQRFSMWRWLLKGLRADRTGIIIAFSLLLWGIILGCAFLGYALYTAI